MSYFNLKFRMNFLGHVKNVIINILFFTVYKHALDSVYFDYFNYTYILKNYLIYREEKNITLVIISATRKLKRFKLPLKLQKFSCKYMNDFRGCFWAI